MNNDYVKPTSINQRQLLKEYLAKLDDPEYVQNLTKAHVYHDKELRAKADGPLRQPLIGSERVTYIQDSNPFFLPSKGTRARVTPASKAATASSQAACQGPSTN